MKGFKIGFTHSVDGAWAGWSCDQIWPGGTFRSCGSALGNKEGRGADDWVSLLDGVLVFIGT